MKLTSTSAYFYAMQIMVEGKKKKKKENRMNMELNARVNVGLLERNDTSQIYQKSSKKSFNLWSDFIDSLSEFPGKAFPKFFIKIP